MSPVSLRRWSWIHKWSNLACTLFMLLLSQPLHFGDHGGQWMKFFWAMLDIATIVILVTGL